MWTVCFSRKDENFEKIENIRHLIINILNNYDGTGYVPLETNCSEISLVLLFLYRCGDFRWLLMGLDE